MEKQDNDQKILLLQDENRRLNGETLRLQRAVEELGILNEIAMAINSTLALDKIFDLIIQRCVHHLRAEQGAVMLLEEQKAARPFQTICRVGDTGHQRLPFRLDSQLTGWMLKNRAPLLINDLRNDRRFTTGEGDLFPVHSLLCVPMVCKGKMSGLLTVFNKKTAVGFSVDDQRLLAIIASESAQVIENARLAEKEKALLHVQEELRLAYEIQTNLLPKEAPRLSGYDIAGKNIPAKEVGGDYYDFLAVEKNRLAFCLGDVSGKGLPAAMLMANLQATLRGQTLLANSPKQCIERSNKLLLESTSDEKYATLFYGILDTATHQFSYTNAGHNPPIILSKDGSMRLLRTGGIMIAMMDSFPFEEETVSFLPGDTLIIYSDGITEAINDKEDEFGEERLEELLKKIVQRPPEEMITSVIDAVNAHAGNMPQMDDMTLVVLKMGE